MQASVRSVKVEESLSDYLLDLIDATRTHPDIHLGGSTRAALALYRAAQALAVVEGRDYVVPDDIKRLAPAVLAHRILLKNYRHSGRSDTGEVLVVELLKQRAVPV